MSFDIIILAAGNGKRMESKTPKILCEIGNLPIINHIFNTISCIPYKNTFLVIDEGVKINNLVRNCHVVYQKEKLGTAYAVNLALDFLKESITLILYGDSPFITFQTLNEMLKKIETGIGEIILFAFELKNLNDPYGRLVINDKNFVERVLEYRDIGSKNDNLNLANSGIMAIKTEILKKHLPEIKNKNAQKEYYLTDIVNIVHEKNIKVCYIKGPYEDALGVNTQSDLTTARFYFQQRIRNHFVKIGVNIIDQNSVFFSYDTKIIGEGVTIHPNVVFFEGVTLEANVEILPNCCLKKCLIKNGSKIGPFANIDENSIIGENSCIGNFVQSKNSCIESGVKVKHLSYIGNSKIGENSNIGAGTITCNYDGKQKHETNIGKNCFVGANTVFVAPITMSNNSRTAAGSTITQNIPEDTLAIARSNQINKKRVTQSSLFIPKPFQSFYPKVFLQLLLKFHP